MTCLEMSFLYRGMVGPGGLGIAGTKTKPNRVDAKGVNFWRALDLCERQRSEELVRN